jgi:hypothetical protein
MNAPIRLRGVVLINLTQGQLYLIFNYNFYIKYGLEFV